jgi:Ca-activated chloride channel homolog
MRCITGILTLGLFFLGLVFAPAFSFQAEKKEKGKEPEKTDITDEVRKMHTDQFQAPPKDFRTGHATPRKFDDKLIKKTELGFEVQLPSKAPILTPTVYKGKVYVTGGFHSKEYYCFDAVTGKLVWAVDLDDDGPTSSVVDDDICVFNTESCTIFALDANTGKHLWSYFLGDPLTSTPTIANGKVFTSYPTGGRAGVNMKKGGAKTEGAAAQGKRPNASHAMICLELKTGKILWQRWLDSDVMSAPVAVGDEVYATSFSGTVYKFKQKDGEILSAHCSRATSAPVIVGKNVYMTQRADSGKDGKVAEQIAKATINGGSTADFDGFKRNAEYLDPQVQDKSDIKGKAVAADSKNGLGGLGGMANAPAAYANIGQGNISTMQGFQGSRILNYKDSNFNCMGNEVVCTDPADGKVRWKVKLEGDLAKIGGFLATAPAAAGGKLFLATVQGELLQIDPSTGKVELKYKVGAPVRSQPAIDSGRVYVGTLDGKLVCIDTGHPEYTGWSTWGANAAHTNLVEKR